MSTGSRVALVIGGTSGIGAAISEALLAAGYRVAANYGRNAEGASRNVTVTVTVTVNAIAIAIAIAIAPGYTDTAMVSAVKPEVMEQILKSVPTGRLAMPTEIARGVVFLAADESCSINGVTLSINGAKYLT